MSVGTSSLGAARGGVSRRQTLVVMAIAAVILGLAVLISTSADDGLTQVNLANAQGGSTPVVGQAPTPFSGRTYDGEAASLADYAGKPVWLTFGASWCRDCRVEAPELEAVYEQYRPKGLNVLAVFINDPADDIAGFATRVGLTFPIIADETGKIGSAYRLMGIPTHVFIGADGLVKQVRIGALSKADMEQAIQQIVPQG